MKVAVGLCGTKSVGTPWKSICFAAGNRFAICGVAGTPTTLCFGEIKTSEGILFDPIEGLFEVGELFSSAVDDERHTPSRPDFFEVFFLARGRYLAGRFGLDRDVDAVVTPDAVEVAEAEAVGHRPSPAALRILRED